MILLAGIFWLFFKLINLLIYLFKTPNPNVAAAIIVASATIFTSTLTIVLGRYFESKREREAVHRDKKIILYDEFLKKLFDIFLGGAQRHKNENLVPFLREIQRKLILWSGPNVIKSYAEWHEVMTKNSQNPKAKSLIKMMDFYLALRKDLGHSNKGIKRDHLIRFMLKKPELFMNMYEKNSEVTFDEISMEEKKFEHI